MEKFRTKKKKQGGFTLIEMLIVVAIIAILIAVSIPLVGTALERARKATDAANERSAKAEALIMYMTNGQIGDDEDTKFTPATWYYYDAVNGRLLEEPETDAATYGKCKAHEDLYLWVLIGSGEEDEGEADVVYLNWSVDQPTTVESSDDLDSEQLITE